MSTDSMRSVTRTISVLRSFTPEKPQLSPADIAQQVCIPKPTIYRILACLTKARLLERSGENGSYAVGPALYTLGSLYLTATDLFKASQPVIEMMNELTGELVDVAILGDKGHITFILQEESKHGLKVSFRVGSSSLAYAHALGKALLSELTDDQLDCVYSDEKLKALTKHTVPTKTELKRELKQIRENGYAFISEQALDGVEAVAAVIRDNRGKVIAATSIGWPAVRVNEAKRQKLATLIKLGASLISYRLGYQGSDNLVHGIEEIFHWWEQD